MHQRTPEVLVEYRDGNLLFRAKRGDVEKSLDNLYNRLSSGIHFNAGERYPLKIIQFKDDSDTLALISFLKHYFVDFYVVPPEPVPTIKASRESPADTSHTSQVS